MINLVNRRILVERAREWIGTPFKLGCCIQGTAADCGLFLSKIGAEMGYSPESLTDRKNAFVGDLTFFSDEYLFKIPMKDREPGDILLMFMPGCRVSTHIALVTELPDGREGILHTHSKVGKVVEHGLDEVWLKRVKQAYRIPNIDEETV